MFICNCLCRASRFLPRQRSDVPRSSNSIANAFATMRRRRLSFVLAAFMLTMVIGASILSGDPPTPPPTPPNVPPTIADFVATKGLTQWTIEGQVLDEDPLGLVVTFGGLLSGHSKVITNQYGYFAYGVSLDSDGLVTAHTVDSQGQESDYETVAVIQ